MTMPATPTAHIVDSGVLLALCDSEDRRHPVVRQAVEEHLAAGGTLVVPVTCLSQVLVGAFRTTPYAVRTVEGFVDELVDRVWSVDRAVGRAAAQVRTVYPRLPLGDALVLATAQVAGVPRILTTAPYLTGLDPRILVLGD